MPKWNDWHGLTEGDMVDELVERDVVCYSEDPLKARAYWDRRSDEQIRKSWWMEIGRYEHGEKEPTTTFVPDGKGGYIYLNPEED